ncbi:MAG: hypothetical protein R2827_12055 [Bdellovibrionales bacterium]
MNLADKLRPIQPAFVAGVKELYYHSRAFHLYPLGLFENKRTLAQHSIYAPNKKPVLFVHGVIHNRSAFFPMKKYLIDRGYRNLYSMNYSTRHGSLIGMVEDLANRVDEVLLKTGSDQVDIVAHSLGGLVSRYFMSVGEGRGKVRQLITLGTAHKGTNASVLLKLFLSGSLSRDLRRKSYFIKTLNQTPIPSKSKIVSIYSKNDWTVWPHHSCHLDGDPGQNLTNCCVESTGHLGLLYNPLVFESVHQHLSGDSF